MRFRNYEADPNVFKFSLVKRKRSELCIDCRYDNPDFSPPANIKKTWDVVCPRTAGNFFGPISFKTRAAEFGIQVDGPQGQVDPEVCGVFSKTSHQLDSSTTGRHQESDLSSHWTGTGEEPKTF